MKNIIYCRRNSSKRFRIYNGKYIKMNCVSLFLSNDLIMRKKFNNIIRIRKMHILLYFELKEIDKFQYDLGPIILQKHPKKNIISL